MVIPCAMSYTLYDGTKVTPDEECIWDKELVMEYIGDTVQIEVYHN